MTGRKEYISKDAAGAVREAGRCLEKQKDTQGKRGLLKGVSENGWTLD